MGWFRLVTILAIVLVCGCSSSGSAQLPRVHLLATGGTIADATTGKLTASDLRRAVPGIDRLASITVEDFSDVGSSRMTPDLQFQLAKRVNWLLDTEPDLSAIVVTHGTDTLEETAFFLDLVVYSGRPVIFAAAQRPPDHIASDGARNLENAVRVATCPRSCGKGVLVTMNDEIHAARNVRKIDSTALGAFQSPETGPIGIILNGQVYYFCDPLRRLTLVVESIEPRVDLITLVAGSDGHLIRASVASGARGIVVEVFGRGNVPPSVMDAVAYARKSDVTVVFTTRTRNGPVALPSEAAQMGVLSSGTLDGLKARMLLVATLCDHQAISVLQGYFDQLSGCTP